MSNQMGQIYSKHNINRQYDLQDSYASHESYYGDGRYPPDWDNRREAVWEQQQYQCGRCGIYKGDASVGEVHHIVHLSDGGSNRLDNLVGLCGSCHALMHPKNEELRGNPWQADLFPNADADQRVAVIREPKEDDELETDLQRLSQLSSPDENANAVTSATIPTDAELAKQADNELPKILIENGFVPRVTPYHRVSVIPKPKGILAAITPRGITISATGDGQTTEFEENNDIFDIYHTADTNHSKIELEDPSGDKQSHLIELEHGDGERLSVQSPISAPPLSTSTLPEYTFGALQYFGWDSLKIGLIPGLIITLLLPSTAPGSGSLGGVIGISLIIGLLLRSASIYQDFAGTATERVVNERNG